MGSRVLHIDDRLDGSSLAQALKQLLRESSWSEVKRLIARRHVQVHGNLCLDEGRRLRAGDVVKVWDEPLAKPPGADDLNIRYRDADIAIVEKPAGVTTQREPRETHAGRAQRQATLDEILQQAIDRLGPVLPRPVHQAPAKPKSADGGFIVRRRGEPASRGNKSRVDRPIVRPVHRLDRDTSGLMVFALSHEAESRLIARFKDHSIERLYRAVVVGAVRQPVTIRSDLTRDRGDGLRGSTTDRNAPDRQHAVTHVRPIQAIGEAFTVVECRLETGRTHQIRIHLAEQGHMLCGEKTYVRPLGGRPAKDPSDAPRQALHAWRLALEHPITGERLAFESDWPADLRRWLDRLLAVGH